MCKENIKLKFKSADFGVRKSREIGENSWGKKRMRSKYNQVLDTLTEVGTREHREMLRHAFCEN